jgi:SAM-dependent methyltransferase
VAKRSLLASVRARLGRTPSGSGADRPAEAAWRDAIDGEVGFWRTYLETKGARYPGSYETRFDPELPLQDWISDLVDAPAGATVRILDVGAGPLTFVGRRRPGWDVEITAVDALGRQYGELLDELGLEPPVRTQACETERLSELLAADSFDLVTARNTLDHSYDPIRAIGEMLHCAKPGAATLLVHHRNEGEDEDYHGMHQWNFEAGDGTLVVWRPGVRTDVLAALAGRATLERTWVEGTWEHVVLRKA